MSSYAEHQNIGQEIGHALLKNFPNKHLFFARHVGLFYTKRGTPIMINFPGMADYELYLTVGSNLMHIEIEIKSGNAVQSAKQKRYQNAIQDLNGLYILARNAEDVIEAIYKKWPELLVK